MTIKHSLTVSLDDRTRIETKTRDQSAQKEWHEVRLKRITGSICGKIICQKKISSLLSKGILSPLFHLNPILSLIHLVMHQAIPSRDG